MAQVSVCLSLPVYLMRQNALVDVAPAGVCPIRSLPGLVLFDESNTSPLCTNSVQDYILVY
jgi:hypothetical protein